MAELCVQLHKHTHTHGGNTQTHLLTAPLTPLILQESSMRWRRGNKTSLSLLVSAPLDIVIPVLMPGAILPSSHEALWFVCTNILKHTAPIQPGAFRHSGNSAAALSFGAKLDIYISTVHQQKDRQSHYTQECAGTHTQTHTHTHKPSHLPHWHTEWASFRLTSMVGSLSCGWIFLALLMGWDELKW